MKKLAAFEYVKDMEQPQQVAEAAAKAALGVLVQASTYQRGSVKLGDVVLVEPGGVPTYRHDPLSAVIGAQQGQHAIIVFAECEPEPQPQHDEA